MSPHSGRCTLIDIDLIAPSCFTRSMATLHKFVKPEILCNFITTAHFAMSTLGLIYEHAVSTRVNKEKLFIIFDCDPIGTWGLCCHFPKHVSERQILPIHLSLRQYTCLFDILSASHHSSHVSSSGSSACTC